MEFTTLCSGSSGNCIYVRGGKTRILVDAGCSMRYLQKSLAALGSAPEEISAIFITHEHSDHISGAAQISRRFGIPLFASPATWEKIPFVQDFFSWERHTFEYGMEIGDLQPEFFKLSHDAVQPVGMVFGHGGQRVGIVTDTGKVTEAMCKQLHDVDGLVIEANYNRQMLLAGPYPEFLKRRILAETGHLENSRTAEALLRIIGARTQTVLLSHLSEKNNTPRQALEDIRARWRQEQFSAACAVSVAYRKEPHPLVQLA